MPDIIFDNCVLSNFALSEAYPIIETLYADTAYVTDFVAAENMTGIARGHRPVLAWELRLHWIIIALIAPINTNINLAGYKDENIVSGGGDYDSCRI